MILLSDDVGPIVTLALVCGAGVFGTFIFAIFTLLKGKSVLTRITFAVIGGLLLSFLIIWLVINFIGYL